MSKTITGVIDMPFVNFSDLDTIEELLEFLIEEGILNLSVTTLSRHEQYIKIKEGIYHWLEIHSNGTIKFDDMYEKRKNEILDAIQEYYPQFKTAKDIIEENHIREYKMHMDKEKEELLVEVEL